ncbi:MAG: hypothetical protein AAF927_29335 [Bacteroidota bacterium]
MKKITNIQLLACFFTLFLMVAVNTQAVAQKKAPISMEMMADMSDDIDAPVVLEINETPDTAAEPIVIFNDRSMKPVAPLTSPVMEVEGVIVAEKTNVMLSAPCCEKENAACQTSNLRALAGSK